eukprot:GHVU01086029.1.p2 GENE.GHVU01086029.1~~GHVU01086029.1.p2  ORF type:complete len:115 (+),score=13.36 GHVU01086029.1:416-760(+)
MKRDPTPSLKCCGDAEADRMKQECGEPSWYTEIENKNKKEMIQNQQNSNKHVEQGTRRLIGSPDVNSAWKSRASATCIDNIRFWLSSCGYNEDLSTSFSHARQPVRPVSRGPVG